MYFHPSITYPERGHPLAALSPDGSMLSGGQEGGMLKILIPIDGSPSADRAVELVAKLYPRLGPAEIRLLYVRPPELLPPEPLLVRRPGNEASRWIEATRTSRGVLDEADVPYTAECRAGHVPQVIATYAKSKGCSAVVMGTRGMRSPDHLHGSIARQVVNLVDVPVTLVK